MCSLFVGMFWLAAGLGAGVAVAEYDPTPLSGADMPSKLGLCYIMGETESVGLVDLAATGWIPLLKAGYLSTDRIMWCKQANPACLGIVSGGGEVYWATQTPEQAADMVIRRASEQYGQVPPEHRPHMDFLEIMPCMWEPKSASQAIWYASMIALAAPEIARQLKIRPIVLVSGVGGLPTGGRVLEHMVPGLRAALAVGGAWACHGYTIKYTTDEHEEKWHSLRYRGAYDYFREHHPDLMQLPMILVEGGVDDKGDPDKDGWMARGTQKQYQDWLAWYDAELKKDPYVLGVTLFKIGAPSIWQSFEMEPLVPWLREHYRQAQQAAHQ